MPNPDNFFCSGNGKDSSDDEDPDDE